MLAELEVQRTIKIAELLAFTMALPVTIAYPPSTLTRWASLLDFGVLWAKTESLCAEQNWDLDVTHVKSSAPNKEGHDCMKFVM